MHREQDPPVCSWVLPLCVHVVAERRELIVNCKTHRKLTTAVTISFLRGILLQRALICFLSCYVVQIALKLFLVCRHKTPELSLCLYHRLAEQQSILLLTVCRFHHWVELKSKLDEKEKQKMSSLTHSRGTQTRDATTQPRHSVKEKSTFKVSNICLCLISPGTCSSLDSTHCILQNNTE